MNEENISWVVRLTLQILTEETYSVDNEDWHIESLTNRINKAWMERNK